MKLAIHKHATLKQIKSSEFTHIISIGDVGCDLKELRPKSISPSSQLCLNFRDRKSRERDDAPCENDIRPLLLWLESTGPVEGLLVHCGAGMSRSPAVALLALCYFFPDINVHDNMCQVADCAVANYIWPNPLVIELGDNLMQRNGQIIAGVNQWRSTIEPDFTK